MTDPSPGSSSIPPIIVVSGGRGVSGEQLARTALAQFNNREVPVEIVGEVKTSEQVRAAVARAEQTGGTIVHTLVDADLRQKLIVLARERNVTAIDLIGGLMLHLTKLLGQEPAGRPGLYRQIRETYFKRIEAIEFTVDHDDGRKPHELALAEIVLIGVSRVGKTPLSIYLGTRGWKVANVPLVRGIDPPEQLFTIDPRRVVGLTIDPASLQAFRSERQQKLGLRRLSTYTDPRALYEEVEYAERICQRGGFPVVDITERSIEENADEVIAHVTRRLAQPPSAG
ncbi:MAG: kinase/pyrophosphorylase [Anaerolineae bacterium]|nr:kinase/pyrophosphorylase [Anaerolineae bacterium]